MALVDSSSGSSNSHILNPDAVSKATDLSINYLSQLFGTVGNMLTGTSSQMMGKLFYTLNWDIIIISGVVIGYAVLMSSVRMASEGVTMQPGKSTLFTCLKLAIGIALLIPSASTGYSPLQDIVMSVVKQGVGLADSIWNSGLEYLKEGGVIFTVPAAKNPGFQSYLQNLYAANGQSMDDTRSNDDLISGGETAGIAVATGIISPTVGATFIVVFNKINEITNMFQKFGDDYKYNPITFLHELGQKCISLTMDIWLWAGVGMSATMIGMALCPASNPLGFAASALIEWVKPLFQ